MAGKRETCKASCTFKAWLYNIASIMSTPLTALHASTATQRGDGITVLLQPLLHYSSCTHQTATILLQVLLLDELTTFLDSADQQGVLKAVRSLVGSQGSESVTALWVSIFLHLAIGTRRVCTCHIIFFLIAMQCQVVSNSMMLHVWMETCTCQHHLLLGPFSIYSLSR